MTPTGQFAKCFPVRRYIMELIEIEEKARRLVVQAAGFDVEFCTCIMGCRDSDRP